MPFKNSYLAAVVSTTLLACLPAAAASPLVTGNGFGLAVVSPESARLIKFYAHPYSFSRPDPQNPLGEGVETANFIKELGWSNPGTPTTSTEYLDDSHIIHMRASAGEGFFFMPFGLTQTTLVVSWQPAVAEAASGSGHVEWSRPVSTRRVVRMSGYEMQVLKFDGIQESLLLVPLGQKRPLRRASAGSVHQSFLGADLIGKR